MNWFTECWKPNFSVPINLFYLLCSVLLLIGPIWGHGGHKDGQGGHKNRKQENYHFHEGPLAGQVFPSKSDGTKALAAGGEYKLTIPKTGSGTSFSSTVKTKDLESITSSSVRLSTNSFTTPYGMTSGTSGCKRHSIVQKESKQIHFVEENLDQLELEMSMGKGQFVEQLASLLGCENKVSAFTKTMQKSYSELFQGPKTNPSHLLNSVKS